MKNPENTHKNNFTHFPHNFNQLFPIVSQSKVDL